MRHIFFDNSNIYGGSRRAAETIEPNAPWIAVRIYYRNLFRLIEGQGDVKTRVLSGSVPPENELLWQTARDLGYNTDLLRKVERDNGRLGEQGVDEMLHLKIANTILDYPAP
ncbi:NYN domain-containing protein [Muricoccus aerilatus]|uniref:NYN domain-containing protein n=1 Tax=Muricoccus aerilatus TaxID=452982 RepID=UPI0012EB534D|nr:NYN domain-containing protein [Roseomonas aerilata]